MMDEMISDPIYRDEIWIDEPDDEEYEDEGLWELYFKWAREEQA